jgi:hypothetical protein
LLKWAKMWLGLLNKPLWAVVDGVYAKTPFLKPAKSLGVPAGDTCLMVGVSDPQHIGDVIREAQRAVSRKTNV